MSVIEGLGNKTIVQVCIVVDDVEKYARQYCELFGFEMPQPIFTNGHYESEAVYYNEPTEALAKIMTFALDDVVIELLQPLEGKTVWKDHLDTYGPSVHHIAMRVKDTTVVTDSFAKNGIAVSQQGFLIGLHPNGGHTGVYTYLDTQKALGTTLELLERYPADGPAR